MTEADNFRVACPGRLVQRRLVLVVFFVYVCTCFDQNADRFHVALLGRPV